MAFTRSGELREMLGLLVEHRRRREAAAAAADGGRAELILISGADMVPISRWRGHLKHAREDGVEAALYAVIREAGWQAFAEGGIAAMNALAEAATGNNCRLASILDHRWDGIGAESTGFWVT